MKVLWKLVVTWFLQQHHYQQQHLLLHHHHHQQSIITRKTCHFTLVVRLPRFLSFSLSLSFSFFTINLAFFFLPFHLWYVLIFFVLTFWLYNTYTPPISVSGVGYVSDTTPKHIIITFSQIVNCVSGVGVRIRIRAT